MATIEIDNGSGFCFGVVTAIRKAEEELEKSGKLYCLGDIVHNSNEVERLESKGLQTITHDDLLNLHNVTVSSMPHAQLCYSCNATSMPDTTRYCPTGRTRK